MTINPTAEATARLIDQYVRQRPGDTGWPKQPLERSVGANAATWEHWLVNRPTRHSDATQRALGALIEGGVERHGTHHITRTSLVELAGNGTTDDANVALFVATQIWGSGTTNGRGPRFTHAALTDPRLTDTLAATRKLSREGDLAGAYRTFHVSGVGPSFFTKWLWSSTLDIDPPRRPLILDVRVIQSLNALGWRLSQAAGRRADRYAAYVDYAHDIAAATPAVASAEHVEAMLFERGEHSLSNWLDTREQT